jgi:hypothetical protein
MMYKALFTKLMLLFSIAAFSQNVGIGTNNPLSKLHVAGTIRSDTLIYLGPGVRTLFATPNGRIYDSLVAAANWQINGNSNITAAQFLGTTNANDLIFKTNNIERGRFLSGNGFLGLGTTTPGSRLEVSAIGGDGITIKATAGTDAGDLMFFDAAGVEKGRVYTNPLATSGLILSGGTIPAAHVFINNAGNVGIGNSAPNNRLEITAAAANTSGLRFTNLTSASPTIAANGKALSVDANGDVVLMPSASDAWKLLGNAGTTAGTNFLGTTDAQDLVFKTNNTEKVRVTTVGLVGIGTAAPREILEIANFAGSTGHNLALSTQGELPYWSVMKRPSTYSTPNNFHIAFWDGASWNLYFDIRPNGNVGIGNTMPATSAKVEIASTTAGFAMPRMTSAQRKAIVAPIAGLQVYDIDLKGFYVFDGAKWDCANNPAGTVQYFANTVAPNGYLECNGQAVNRIGYAELFSAIGTTYGIGDGVTTFNLPDLRGEFVRGADNGRGADPGRVIGTGQSPSPVVHDDTMGAAVQNGDFSMDNAAAAYSDPWPGALAGGIPNAYWSVVPPGGWTVYSGTTTGGAAYGMIHGARPRNVALMPCIKF